MGGRISRKSHDDRARLNRARWSLRTASPPTPSCPVKLVTAVREGLPNWQRTGLMPDRTIALRPSPNKHCVTGFARCDDTFLWPRPRRIKTARPSTNCASLHDVPQRHWRYSNRCCHPDASEKSRKSCGAFDVPWATLAIWTCWPNDLRRWRNKVKTAPSHRSCAGSANSASERKSQQGRFIGARAGFS